MATLSPTSFSIEDFLTEEREKDLLRFSTAGSVDDGKSTLIGRLLYDTQSVYEDQVRSIEGKGTTAPGQIDFALLTDGLRAEREQGITIDVAYRYFATSRRKFIIADTPGHEQYTRNMATGASTADAAVVLIDASKGVLLQSRRHAYIASLLRVRHVLVAVNKMDLIGYDEAAFLAIEDDFTRLLGEIAEDTGNAVDATFVPVSALAGDNIVHRSKAMPWYEGRSLLELLESLPASEEARLAPFRFPVQRVLRPDANFRGFAGQIASGTVRAGDEIAVHPSGRTAQIARIVTFDGDLEEAQAPLSVTLVLDREVDISRGDLIVPADEPAAVSRNIQAALVWMDERPLQRDRRYLLKHTSHTVPAVVTSIDYRTDIATLRHEPAETLSMNNIGVVSLRLLRPIAVDLYSDNRSTGAFVLIDAESNHTVAAGMITAVADPAGDAGKTLADEAGPVSTEEKAARWGHFGGVLELNGSSSLIDHVERALFQAGMFVARIDSNAVQFATQFDQVASVAEWSRNAGVLALLIHSNNAGVGTASVGEIKVLLDEHELSEATLSVLDLLSLSGLLHASRKADRR
jgi:sulfate adenylyltransferase subunit 1